MKLRSILAVALTAVVFAACSKSEDSNENKDAKSVLIKFEEEGYTRAIGAPVANNTTVVFGEGKLYLANSTGVIRKVYDFHPTNATNVNDPIPGTTIKIGDVVGVPAGLEIENVPGDVTQAVLVGNHSSMTGLPTSGNISGVKDFLVTPAMQGASTDITSATLYGECTLTVTAPNKLEANITLKPHVARIELVDITGNGTITGFDIDGVFINKYYEGVANNRALISPSTLKDNGAGGVTTYGDNTAAYPTALKARFYDYDAATHFGNATATLTKTPDGLVGKVWSYNLLAPESTVPANLKAAQMVVSISGVTSSMYTFTGPQLLTVNRFVDMASAEIAYFEAGKVYSINAGQFTFDENNVKGTANTSPIDVTVKVTLIKWTVVPMKPELQ